MARDFSKGQRVFYYGLDMIHVGTVEGSITERGEVLISVLPDGETKQVRLPANRLVALQVPEQIASEFERLSGSFYGMSRIAANVNRTDEDFDFVTADLEKSVRRILAVIDHWRATKGGEFKSAG